MLFGDVEQPAQLLGVDDIGLGRDGAASIGLDLRDY
jgi:hypothetical protein